MPVANARNFFKNLFFGAEKLYRDQDNLIKEANERGVLGSICDFVRNLGSAFNNHDKNRDSAPGGFFEHAVSFFSRIKGAVFGDLIQGVAGNAINAGEDLVLAGWNLLEVIPDATVGNLPGGKDLTTTVFDNGQVAIDYLTDILPTGEAWLRVHASSLNDMENPGLPLFYNLNMPEQYTVDARWRYVRNTPLRKTIETVGALLADLTAAKLFHEAGTSSEQRHQKN